MKHTLIVLSCIAILLSACTLAPVPPTATPVPATATPLPPTETPEPTAPVEMPNIMPVVDSWEGVPVMPGALSGMFDLGDYFYVIDASEEEIAAFYEAEMPALGWQPREEMTAKAPGTAFTYYRDGRFVFFLIEPDGDHLKVFMLFVSE